ncbi:carboxylating nicotinate-nucleotide diphosphorylase [Prochlorococcus sp. MIT 1307]|uniref:carboxylating nicotinate-nucleotide diphosphorylase n=1 Tax=Prochlorococcus sp. MIT 1307 TaxID=3096219 RepID=UPI002A758211|nr:carboxylating nicotinate-nucleotide diphosphorylase [Prochlorococcus sp. MIT 1307]
MDINTPKLNNLLDSWLDEDLGRGDLTNIALVDRTGSAHWIAKQNGIFCGGKLVERIFKRMDKSIEVNLLIKDGESFESGQKLLKIQGPAATLASGERTSLNLAMRLSGIATATAALVNELKGTGILLADTRKTTPGLRVLEKYAFRCGGGINHRLGLDDAAMLKENHIAWAGGIKPAMQAIKATTPWPSQIIVEVEYPEQAKEAIQAGADGVLLDELTPAQLDNLVPQLRKLASTRTQYEGSNQIVIEVSGIDPMNLKAYAGTGIDLISTSAPMTRSSWIDFSMRFETS